MSYAIIAERFILIWNRFLKKEGIIKTLLFSLIYIFLLSIQAFAQAYPNRYQIIAQELDRIEGKASINYYNQYEQTREQVIKETVRKISIELALEYGFSAQGEQSFDLFNDYNGDGVQEKVSRLEYPYRGRVLVFKGEIGFLSKFFVGGRYGNSGFKNGTCSDEDWNLFDPTWPFGTDSYIDYQRTTQDSQADVEFFDLNLYYRLLDLKEDKAKQMRLQTWEKTAFDILRVNKLSLDVFAGYQNQKGRYSMKDPMQEWVFYDEGTWYYVVGLPANIGLDSFYRSEYKGPRLGLRMEGSKGKWTSRVRFAFAWLDTKAHGWWNLRNLSYWQSGKDGYGIDFGLEVLYRFTPYFSLGLGFDNFYYKQKELSVSAIEEGVPWPEGPTVRNAESRMFFPSLILNFVW